jgi:YVTN family beta-propeller protein
MLITNARLMFLASLLLGALSVVDRASAAGPALILERRIPLANVKGRIDHMAVDLERKRLLVAELGNDSVDVIDLTSAKVIHRIKVLKEPQGVAYLAGPDLILVANAGDGSVEMYRADNWAPVETISLGDDADNIRIDPRTGQALVGYGSGGLAIVDPLSRSAVGDVKLAGHPEGFQIDPKTDRVFANVPDAHQIAVIELGSRKQVATWKVPGLQSNFPMALGEEGGFLVVVFRNPARLVLLDTTTGAVTQSLETCGDADDVFFDRKRNRIYVTCGDGQIDVVQLGSDGIRRLERVVTSRGARTSLFAPDLDRLFVAARAEEPGSAAAILVLRPDR